MIRSLRWLRRPSLTTQLVTAWLLIGLMVAFVMGVAVRMNFEQGFHGYVDARDEERTQAWSRALEAAYREHGSWDFLISDRTAWWRLMAATARSTGNGLHASTDDLGLPDLANWPPFGMIDPPPDDTGPDVALHGFSPSTSVQDPPDPVAIDPPSSPTASPARAQPTSVIHAPPSPPMGVRRPPPRPPAPPMALLDARKQVVAGRLPREDEAAWHALHNGDQVIGWLVTARPGQGALTAIDRRFQDAQTRAVMTIGMVVALIAGVLGWAVARRLLAPVRRLALATHRIAHGDYTAQVSDDRDDDLGRLATDFNRMAQALDRHETSRRALLADVSHELRTPLAVLRGEIEALQDGVRAASPDALESLLGEVAALSRLVDDVHDLAAADSGAWSYVMAPLDLATVVASATAAFIDRFATKGLSLVRPMAWPSAPVHGDERRLAQLVRNLLENAVRYTDPDGRVEMDLVVNAERVVLTVQDSAPGVAPQHLPRLFERFYRTEDSRSRAHGGSGLGLALCRQIVQAHAGSIDASASPLGGVRITVALPGHLALPSSPPGTP